jgi:membrane protease YdiL (CAAX protease family)
MLPEKLWKPEAVLRLGMSIFLCLVAGVLVLSGLDRHQAQMGKAAKDFCTFVIGMAFFQGAALLWIRSFLRSHAAGWREAFGLGAAGLGRLLKLSGLAALVVLPAAFLLGKVAELVLGRLGLAIHLQMPVKLLQNDLPAWQFLIIGGGAIVLAPVVEEILFRGILYPTLKQSGHRQLALWMSSGLFALIHANLMAFVPLIFLALVLTWLYEKTGDLLAPILTHALFNAVMFALLVIQPRWLNVN